MQESNKLLHKDALALAQDYAMGMSKDEIAAKYNIHTAAINSYLAQVQNRQHEITYANYVDEVREVCRINEIKDETFDFYLAAMREANSKDKKLPYLKEISEMLAHIDKMARLTKEQATEIIRQDTTERTFDVAEIMNQLKSSDDKKAFLLRQVHDSKNKPQKTSGAPKGKTGR